jgi:predicted nuclease of predicted toxin-antitoxin system
VARFYADEQYPRRVVEFLRTLGHDVLTVQEAGNANQKIPDEEVLAFALSIDRAILTLNRRHFIKLHTLKPDHPGIIVCKDDSNRERLAARIDEAISNLETLRGMLIRVNRPSD